MRSKKVSEGKGDGGDAVIGAIAERIGKAHMEHASTVRFGYMMGWKAALPHILALRKRVKHEEDCDFLQGMDYAPMGDTYVPVPYTEPPCSCGYEEDMEAIDKLIKPK